MPAFLRKLFEKYARQVIVSGGEGITKIPNKDRVRALADDIYKDFKEAGVPDGIIKSEADIKFFHTKVNELYEANLARNLKNQLERLKPKESADVLDLTGKKIDTSKPILGGKNVPESEVQNNMEKMREFIIKNQSSKTAIPLPDIVTETIAVIKSKKPIDAMAEANLVIARKGKYKNLTIDESQEILKKTNDHIFERDIKYDEFGEIIKPDPEDFADGGRTGYFTGALADTKQGKAMSPGTSADYSPGQGHRATADANKQLAEIVKMHNMKTAPKPPKRTIRDKIGGGITRVLNNPWVRGYAAWGTGGLSEKLRASMMAKQLYDHRNILGDEAIKEEVQNIPTMGGITPAYAQGGRTSTGLNYLLGEDDQNSRVPYAAGSTQSDFDQYLKEREQRDKEEQKRKFKKDFEDWKKWQDTQGGTMDFAAEGGRIGFGLGGGFNAARRAFLKMMGAGAATGVAAKSGLFSLLKSGKPAIVKDLTSIPIKGGVDGMPVWFKPLVNKVIGEGDDVTKKFATVDREIVHAAELPGSKTKVLVTQDLNTGNVAVDIGMGKHGFGAGHHGQPVRLEYKAGEVIEPIKGKKGTKTKEEFWVEEAEFTGGHPENVKFEESTIEKFGEHGSDFSEVEEFATGLKKGKGGSGHMASGGRVPLSGGLAGMLGE